jgi:hypothetical protein
VYASDEAASLLVRVCDGMVIPWVRLQAREPAPVTRQCPRGCWQYRQPPAMLRLLARPLSRASFGLADSLSKVAAHQSVC